MSTLKYKKDGKIHTVSVGSGGGEDGYSPSAKVEQTEDGVIITITDKDGTTKEIVRDGQDGIGIASVEQTVVSEEDGGKNVMVITLSNEDTHTFFARNGSKGSTGEAGADGADGVSPTVEVSKTGGVTAIKITDVNGTKTATINDGEVMPDYVIEETDRVAAQVLSHQNENTFSFLAISDMHNSETAGDVDKIQKALTHAGQAMALLREKLQIDFAVNFGDWTWGAKGVTTVAMGKSEILSAVKMCHESFRDVPHFYLKGNHDDLAWNLDGYFTPSETFAMLGKRNIGSVFPTAEKERGYCYRDFEDHKLRVIALNTVDSKGIAYPVDLIDSDGSVSSDDTTIARISPQQLNWLATEALDMTGKTGWSVIIIGHHYLKLGYTKLMDSAGVYWDQGCSHVVTLLDAYINGASGTLTMPVSGETVSYDFSGKNDANLVATFNGHLHNFKTGVQGTNEIPWITIPNAFPGRDNERGQSGDYVFGEEVTYPKTEDTAEDTAFCVITIDLAANKIYADHYGAGYDRVIGYNGTVIPTYSVTNDLTNAVNSNAAAEVSEGASYAATITPETGYKLTAVTVTMGGVDLTAELIPALNEDGCAFTIDSVTGDIVITAATAVVEDDDTGGEVNYTNLVPTATTPPTEEYQERGTEIWNGVGYQNNTRTSSMTTQVTVDGYVTTGVIQWRETRGAFSAGTIKPIYIKGATVDTSDAYVRLNIIADAGSGLRQTTQAQAGTGTWATLFTVEALGDQYYKLTPIESGIDSWYNVLYFMVSLIGSGENLIITVDEPIE